MQSGVYKKKQTIKAINVTAVNERWQMDLVVMEKYKNHPDNKPYLFNIVDMYSKFAWSYAIEDKTAITIVRILRKLFYNEGPPAILQSDNGTEFKNSLVAELCRRFRVKQNFSRPRNPQANGGIERLNQTIKKFLAKRCCEVGNLLWTRYLDEIIYEYNTKIHRSSCKTPFQVQKRNKGYNV